MSTTPAPTPAGRLAAAIAHYDDGLDGPTVIPAGDQPGDLGRLFNAAAEPVNHADLDQALADLTDGDLTAPWLVEVIAAARGVVAEWHDGTAATTDRRRFEPTHEPTSVAWLAIAYVGATDHPDPSAGPPAELGWTDRAAFQLYQPGRNGPAATLHADLDPNQRLVLVTVDGRVAAWYGVDVETVELSVWSDGVITVDHIEPR